MQARRGPRIGGLLTLYRMPPNVAQVQFAGVAMNEKSLFVQANSLLRSRRYEEAIALYEEVRRKGQHPHGIIDFNLDLARRRLTSSGISRPSPRRCRESSTLAES